MSIRVMTDVWDRFPGAGSELLVMLALADWCNDDGGSLYPSIAAVATKIRASTSQARRILHALIEDGWVSVVGNEAGGAPGTTRHYRVNVGKLASTPRIGATAGVDARGGADARDGLHGCAETAGAGASLTVNTPTKEPSKKKGAQADALRAMDLPDGVPRESWVELVEHRQAIRKPMSDLAAGKMLKRLAAMAAAGHSVKAAIDNTIENGWTGVFEPRGFGGSARPAGMHNRIDGGQRSTAEIEAEAEQLGFRTRGAP